MVIGRRAGFNLREEVGARDLPGCSRRDGSPTATKVAVQHPFRGDVSLPPHAEGTALSGALRRCALTGGNRPATGSREPTESNSYRSRYFSSSESVQKPQNECAGKEGRYPEHQHDAHERTD
jgi:hypothetical protein